MAGRRHRRRVTKVKGDIAARASRTAPASHRAEFKSRCIPSGVTSPANSASVHPFLRSNPRHQPQQVRPGPQPRLPQEERRGHHLSEHLIKVRQPPGRVDPVNAGHHGRSMINQDSHTQMIMRRPSSRHLATPRALTKCCCRSWTGDPDRCQAAKMSSSVAKTSPALREFRHHAQTEKHSACV